MTKTLLLASVAVFALSAPALAQGCCGGVPAPAEKGATLVSKEAPAPAAAPAGEVAPQAGDAKKPAEPEAAADAAAPAPAAGAPAKPAH